MQSVVPSEWLPWLFQMVILEHQSQIVDPITGSGRAGRRRKRVESRGVWSEEVWCTLRFAVSPPPLLLSNTQLILKVVVVVGATR